MPSLTVLVFALIVTAITGFTVGAHYQHMDALLYLHELIQTDPYAFYLRDKIYGAFKLFRFNREELPRLANTTQTSMEELMKYGFPGLDCLMLYSDFLLSFDRRNRVAHWVFEHLTAESVNNDSWVTRRGAEYRPDFRVTSLFRCDVDDYRRSPYDRGHLAAAGNHRRQLAHCHETFFMTNITPQVGPGFNRDAWHELELYTRNLATRYKSVYVCTGPIYQAKEWSNGKLMVEYELIGQHTVAVPTHFFKVIIVESKLPQGLPYMEAYLLPNESLPLNVNLRNYLCPIRDIERVAGLKFYEGIRRSLIFDGPTTSQLT